MDEKTSINNEKQQNDLKKVLEYVFLDYQRLLNNEKQSKKRKSEYNKRYYQKNKHKILSRNKEMRDLYKMVNKN